MVPHIATYHCTRPQKCDLTASAYAADAFIRKVRGSYVLRLEDLRLLSAYTRMSTDRLAWFNALEEMRSGHQRIRRRAMEHDR